jgi:serine/threonine-protein kinase RsbT
MIDNVEWMELARLPIVKTLDVLMARFIGRHEAAKLGFSPGLLTRVATAISEITRNVVQHAGVPGEIRLGRISELGRHGLRIIVSDKGRGIEHSEQFVEGSKAGALGGGLPGTRKLVDRLDIQSAPGIGATVTMDIWKKESFT